MVSSDAAANSALPPPASPGSAATGAARRAGWYWTPAFVFCIGLISVLLLFWIARLGENQRDHFLVVDALDDFQGHLSAFHIRFEEDIRGDLAVILPPAWEQWSRALRLLDAMLIGGLDDHGLTLLPLAQGEYQGRANRIKAAMSSLEVTAAQRLQLSRTTGLDIGIETRFHEEFQAVVLEVAELEDLLEADSLSDYVRSRRLIRAISAAWVLIVVVATAGLFTSENRRMRSEEALRVAHALVLAQTEELTRHEQRLAETVKERTAELSRTNEQLHAEIVERRLAEDSLRETEAQIRQLSSRLLQAQEFERKRLAMELHDELGQALSVIKLQIGIVARGLGAGQAASKEECEKLLAYIDQVITDVRRLSLNLSPTVLEDLGLTAALHWLITGFKQSLAVEVTAEIAQIDQVFPEQYRIVVYRVIQEALTNIARHARAERVAVTIRRHDNEVAILVVDDGVGFDADRQARSTPTALGFGLTTMQERVRMIGGRFALWSRKGKGTRISIGIPLEAGGQ